MQHSTKRAMNKFTDLLVDQPATKDAAYFIAQIQHNVNHGFYVPLDTIKEMNQQPNPRALNKQVFKVVNEKNAVVNERYRLDRDDDQDIIDIIIVGKK